jgi:hypothetical protein
MKNKTQQSFEINNPDNTKLRITPISKAKLSVALFNGDNNGVQGIFTIKQFDKLRKDIQGGIDLFYVRKYIDYIFRDKMNDNEFLYAYVSCNKKLKDGEIRSMKIKIAKMNNVPFKNIIVEIKNYER